MQSEFIEIEDTNNRIEPPIRHFATLTTLCETINQEGKVKLSYGTLKAKKFPFFYKKIKFSKINIER